MLQWMHLWLEYSKLYLRKYIYFQYIQYVVCVRWFLCMTCVFKFLFCFIGGIFSFTYFFSVSNIGTWMSIQKCKGLYGEHCISHIFLLIYRVTSTEATTVTSFLCSLPEILACTSKYENVEFFLCWRIRICFCHAFYRYQRVLLQGWGTGCRACLGF